MSWPPEGSKPPIPPRPTPMPRPRPTPASPGEATGESQVKPQATTPEVKPPQFQHDGIDPTRAALILGLPLLAAGVGALVLFASTTVWWIAGGVAAAGVAGGVALRRSRRARSLLRRFPGVNRAASALKRTANGRFAQSPLGRVLRSRSTSPSSGGSSARPKTLGGRLRSMLPSWAGGTRKPSSSHSTGGSGKPSPGGRMRSLLSRFKPGGGRRTASSGGASGGRPGTPGGSSQGGPKAKPKSLLGKAASSLAGATRRASRAVGTKLFGIRPAASPSSGGGSSKPKSKGKKKPSGGKSDNDTTLDLGLVWTGAGKAGLLVGRGVGALFGRLRKRKKTHTEDDDFDPNSTYEIGIEGEVIDGKHTDAELGRIAERAKQQAAARVAEAARLAKKRAKKSKKAEPEWPNVEPHDGSWPATEPEDGTAPPAPARELPADRDRDPPPSPPASPPPHREKKREAPRITSTNTTHGGNAMAVSAENYAHHIKTTPAGRASGWEDAADHARRDADGFKEKADAKIRAAEAFEKTGNKAAADECRMDAAKFREDESSCRTIAAGYQAEANKESNSAA